MTERPLGIRQLLSHDARRHRELLGGHVVESGLKLWIGMLSPRFAPVLLYRLAHRCHRGPLSPLARLFSLLNFLLFGIEIAVACKIGPGLFFPHTHGTVIGAFTIGKNAVIYQGVTVGAKDLDFTYDADHRPSIGDNVILGAGAKVLGGIELGSGVTVAANAVLLSSVPDNVVVGGIPAKILKSRNS
ncbi:MULTISPECIES: serine O-acetyltransferase [unclassified Pseudomonas]|uniref:serine O-acetyltransferase n=1 Tax=unclassified Pseudomonas TaxID=196821 RepID=UPI0015A4AC9B|nr:MULTISPECIES: DapH/DapD/GlmU-related protein [unclassified Pseudomonas]NWC95266.1 serine acetyltransferase [Pseudomonas sp. IPO3779]NWD17134.1 serine acetyltransferase [Pseudomonas sp. IPO3778]